MVRLGDVCDFVYGFPFNSNFFNDEGDGKPLIRIRDVVPGVTNTFTTESAPTKYDVSDGDLLVGMDGDFNLAQWAGGPALLNQRVCMFKPKPDALSVGFLKHSLGKYLKAIWDKKPFATVKHLSAKDLNAIFLPLPPLPVQREIVERLKRELADADSLVAHFKRIAELADAEFKAELDEAFSAVKGNRVRIGDIGSLVRGSGIKRSDTVPHGRPCIRYGEIYTSFNYVLDQAKSFVPVELYDNCLHIKRGDLVLTLTGENTEEIGKTLAYLGDEEIAAGGDLAVWTNHACNPIYLSYLMYSSALLNAKAAASNGNIIVHASVKKLCDITIPIPSLSEQHLIAAKLDAAKNRCEHLKAAGERGLRASATLRAAILSEAFAP